MVSEKIINLCHNILNIELSTMQTIYAGLIEESKVKKYIIRLFWGMFNIIHFYLNELTLDFHRNSHKQVHFICLWVM